MLVHDHVISTLLSIFKFKFPVLSRWFKEPKRSVLPVCRSQRICQGIDVRARSSLHNGSQASSPLEKYFLRPAWPTTASVQYPVLFSPTLKCFNAFHSANPTRWSLSGGTGLSQRQRNRAQGLTFLLLVSVIELSWRLSCRIFKRIFKRPGAWNIGRS